MTSTTCSCSKEDKIFVLQYLQKIDQEHKQEIQQLLRLIKRLQNQKKVLQNSLEQIKAKLIQNELRLTDIQIKNSQFSLAKPKDVEKIRKIQKFQKIDQQKIDDEVIKYLYRAPIQIIQYSKVIQPSTINLKPQNLQKMQGILTCIIWSKDQQSLQKYEGVNGHWIRSQLQNRKQVIQKILIYNPNKALQKKQRTP